MRCQNPVTDQLPTGAPAVYAGDYMAWSTSHTYGPGLGKVQYSNGSNPHASGDGECKQKPALGQGVRSGLPDLTDQAVGISTDDDKKSVLGSGFRKFLSQDYPQQTGVGKSHPFTCPVPNLRPLPINQQILLSRDTCQSKKKRVQSLHSSRAGNLTSPESKKPNHILCTPLLYCSRLKPIVSTSPPINKTFSRLYYTKPEMSDLTKEDEALI